MSYLIADKDLPAPGTGAPPVELSSAMMTVLRWYESKAPVALPSPQPWPAPDDRIRFSRRALSYPDAGSQPAVANVRLADLDGDARPELIVSDMRYGLVLLGRPYDPAAGLVPIAQVPHPCHAEVVDLDGDGIRDLLVADLGEFYPGDHDHGAVVWLRGLPEGGFAKYAMGGFPRVADVEAADFDGDGKLDLVVAAFGLRRTGEIDILDNHTVLPLRPVFDRRKVDGRPGAIHVIPADLDGDGRLDFVAVISQQYETVVAFMNEGPGRPFRAETIWTAPHPNWGSSGIQLVDFDKDGDLDVLMTNGDMFDDRLLKPYHGVQWLENPGKGKFPWIHHPLAQLPGVHRALAVDLDGDGDLDVVACTFTAGSVGEAEARLPSLVWLEQTAPGHFVRHTLEVGNATHATLDVGDFDGDGDLDIVVGVFTADKPMDHWVEVWENLTAHPRKEARK